MYEEVTGPGCQQSTDIFFFSSVFLLLPLFLLHYPRTVSTSLVILLHVSLSCTTSLHLTVPIFLVSFSTSSSHLTLQFSLVLLLVKLVWFIFLVFLAWFIHCRCVSHLRCCSSIMVPVLRSSYNFQVQLLF